MRQALSGIKLDIKLGTQKLNLAICMQLGTHLRAKKKREEMGNLIRKTKK